MKKNTLLIMLLLLFTINAMATEHKALIVELRNGSTTNLLLNEKPKITFAGQSVKIVSETSSLEFLRSDVKNFHFGTISASAVNEVESNVQITMDGNTIVISGAEDNTVVTVYTLSGVRVIGTKIVDGYCTLSLSELPSGIYIVTYNTTTFKFLKK